MNELFNLAIGVTTAPRKKPTISTMINSVRNAGFPQPIYIFAEPNSYIPHLNNCRVVRHALVHGVFRNWIYAAEEILQHNPKHVLMLQDDVLLSKQAYIALLAGINNCRTSRLGFLSLFTPRMNVIRCGKISTGWIKISPSSLLWGAQAWCFPSETLRILLQTNTIRKSVKKTDGLDVTVGHILGNKRMECYQHIPSLCKHIGYISTLGHKQRRGMNAVGWCE